MLPAETSGDVLQRTPADNATVRNVYVIGPDKKIKLVLIYPMTTGRNFDEVLRVIDSLQLTANHRVATPANWQQGGDVIIAGSVSDDEAKTIYPDGWQAPKPYIRIVPQPEVAHRTHSRSTHARTGGASMSRWAAGIGPDHGGADRHVDPIGIDDDWLGAQAPGQFRDVGVARADDVGPGRERPVGAEQVDPALPQRLVAEVGGQVVDDLDRPARPGAARPATPPAAPRDGVARTAVDEHGQLVAALGGPLDEERVAEVRRVEPPDRPARSRRPRHAGRSRAAASRRSAPRNRRRPAPRPPSGEVQTVGTLGLPPSAASQPARSTTVDLSGVLGGDGPQRRRVALEAGRIVGAALRSAPPGAAAPPTRRSARRRRAATPTSPSSRPAAVREAVVERRRARPRRVPLAVLDVARG